MKRVFSIILSVCLCMGTLFMSTYQSYAAAPAAAVAAWYAFYGTSASEVSAAYASLTSSQKKEADLALGSVIKFGLNLGGIRPATSFLSTIGDPAQALIYWGSRLFSIGLNFLGKESLAYAAYIIDQIKNQNVSYDPDVETSVPVPVTQSVAKQITYSPSGSLNQDISLNPYWKFEYNMPGELLWSWGGNYRSSLASLSYYPDSVIFSRVYDNGMRVCTSSSTIHFVINYDSLSCYFVNLPSYFIDGSYSNSSGFVVNTTYNFGGVSLTGSFPDFYTIGQVLDNVFYMSGVYKIISVPVIDVIRNGVTTSYSGLTDISSEGDSISIDSLDTSSALEDSHYTIDNDQDRVLGLVPDIDNIGDTPLDALSGIAEQIGSTVSIDNSGSAADSVLDNRVDLTGLDGLSQVYTDNVVDAFEPYAPSPGSWIPTVIFGLPSEVIGLISAMMIMLIIFGVVNRMLG